MAEVRVLVKGYTSADSKQEAGEKERTCATISLIIDGDIKMVVDPGILKDKNILIDALKKEEIDIKDINYVALTHSHADHFKNIGLFPNAKLLEFFGIWHEDTVEDWKENFSKNIKIIKTPGHSNTGIRFIVNTNKGKVVVVGDVFWKENLPIEDPYADNVDEMRKSRQKILKIADWIVPGHADMYKVKKMIDNQLNKKENSAMIRRGLAKQVYKLSNVLCKGYAKRLNKSFGWCAEPGWRNGIRTSLISWRHEQCRAGSRFFNENPAPGARNQRNR